MTMKKGVFIFVVGILAYIRSAPTNLETVWLKDVTTRFQTDKRTLSDLDLPNELTFHLRRGSDALTLNLKRNHDINPNADVYFVRRSKAGRSVLVKTRNLEKENVAYYQDRENGAFMTVRCVKRSNEQYDRVINGNIRIGDSSYDLRPEETDVTSRNLLEVPGLLGKRYILQDQEYIQRENSVENKDAAHVNEKNVEQDLVALLRRFERQDKQNHFPYPDATFLSRNVAGLHNRGATAKSRQLKDVYYVKVAVLIDSTIWDLHSSMVKYLNPYDRKGLVKRKIKEAYSHIMNGVNLRYKEIEDTSISISVILTDFIFFKQQGSFPHKFSKVNKVNGTQYIDAKNYLYDIFNWDQDFGANHVPEFDHAMLFTRYNMYRGTLNNRHGGLSFTGRVCYTGTRTSVIQTGDYVWTVKAATHELGHNLGADHDGEKNSIDCKAEDFFIMTPKLAKVDPAAPYSRNPWIFSNCSVEAFKKTLKDKECVKDKGIFYNEQEYNDNVRKHPGEVYTLDEQCHLINGPKSVYCPSVPADICHLMRCTNPKTRRCMDKYFSASTGTECGRNMWCIEGRCVSKFDNNDLE